jgi:hypothetical protein
MRQAARMAGLGYDRFRAIWPRMVEEDGFPPPFFECKWYAPAVRAWRDLRSGLPGPHEATQAPPMTRLQKLHAEMDAILARD